MTLNIWWRSQASTLEKRQRRASSVNLLSGQIRKLEDEIGLQLTERSPESVFTESGLQLVEQAKRILNEVKTG